MNAIAGSTQIAQTFQSLTKPTAQTPTGREKDVRQAFQDFVAGTFYKQMLKSLRKTTRPAAYFDGGQAEKIFQGQMDQQIAEDLARDNGAAFSDPLFQTFAAQINAPHRSGQPQQASISPSRTAESL